ncbi:hypothetical protein BC628DRAFT_200994 [Trametes gibbosa]|nr:hypothetical protein BC628DRAFT_200994 [Trametes gibbosa]
MAQHSQSNALQDGRVNIVEWEGRDGLSSLDGHVVVLDTAGLDSQRAEDVRSAPAHRGGFLKLVGRLRVKQGASVVRKSSGVTLHRKISAALKNLGRHLVVVAVESSGNGAKVRRVLPKLSGLMQETYECVACLSNIDVSEEPAIQVSCGHLYHSECLVQLVQVSMRSPTQFPPRCCRKPVSPLSFEHLLSPEQKEAFAMRQVEQSTTRPVYCANPRCSHFLGARDKRTPVRIYPCPAAACGTLTCARCRATVDPSPSAPVHACAHEAGHRAALRLGNRLGWVRCPECEQLVERDGGCSHMTCACGAHFCYGCGGKWQTCSCVEWRAGAVGELEAPPRPGLGRRERERDLFAPLQDTGDLGGRLTLWSPPTSPAGARTEPWPYRPGPSSQRDRSQEDRTRGPLSDMHVAHPDTAPREAAPLRRQLSGKTESVQMSIYTVDADPTEGHVGSCLPLKLESQVVVRGERPRETRRGARRATTM